MSRLAGGLLGRGIFRAIAQRGGLSGEAGIRACKAQSMRAFKPPPPSGCVDELMPLLFPCREEASRPDCQESGQSSALGLTGRRRPPSQLAPTACGGSGGARRRRPCQFAARRVQGVGKELQCAPCRSHGPIEPERRVPAQASRRWAKQRLPQRAGARFWRLMTAEVLSGMQGAFAVRTSSHFRRIRLSSRRQGHALIGHIGGDLSRPDSPGPRLAPAHSTPRS